MRVFVLGKVAVLSVIVASWGLASVTQALAAPPLNDDFDNATVISGLPFTDVVDTSEATAAPDDPTTACGGPVIATVWYSFTPTSDVRVGFDTSGTAYPTIIAGYTGSRGALSEIGCGYPGFAPLRFDLVAGVTYSFMVFPYPGFAPGLLFLHADVIVPVQAAVTLDPTGLVNPKTGVATVSGTITCSGPSAMTLQGMPGGNTLEQLFAHRVIISGGFDPPVTECTGAAVGWSATVTGSNGLFAPGSAHAHVNIEACSSVTFECAFASADATIRLKASRS